MLSPAPASSTASACVAAMPSSSTAGGSKRWFPTHRSTAISRGTIWVAACRAGLHRRAGQWRRRGVVQRQPLPRNDRADRHVASPFRHHRAAADRDHRCAGDHACRGRGGDRSETRRHARHSRHPHRRPVHRCETPRRPSRRSSSARSCRATSTGLRALDCGTVLVTVAPSTRQPGNRRGTGRRGHHRVARPCGGKRCPSIRRAGGGSARLHPSLQCHERASRARARAWWARRSPIARAGAVSSPMAIMSIRWR